MSQDLLDTLFANVRRNAERAKQKGPIEDRVAALRSSLQDHQRVLERDRSRWISVRSPRQTGKSTAVMIIVSIRCHERARAEWVVIGVTRESIRRIYWGPLKVLSESFELGIKFHEQNLTATFPNGSVIYFVGGDTMADIEKLRGGRYDGAVVDEGKSYPHRLFEELVDKILQPALNTKKGPLVIIGTPGEELRGPFYLATCTPAQEIRTPKGIRLSNRLHDQTPEHPAKWSLHVWTLRDNRVCPWLWTDALELKELNGWADDHPVWLSEYLGHWVPGHSKLVYRYVPHRHDYTPRGDGRFGLAADHEWRTVFGCDLGSVDGTAMVVWAYSPTHPGLWEVYSSKRVRSEDEKLNARTVATWYREVESQYGPFEGEVVDPGGLAALFLDTLADEYQVHWEKAEKKEKLDHIELLNTDLDRGLVHLLRDSELSEEMTGNKWDERGLERGKREEDKNTPNDLCDAALYAFRWANHRRAKDREAQVVFLSPEWWNEFRARELRELRHPRKPDQYENLDAPNPLDWWNEN